MVVNALGTIWLKNKIKTKTVICRSLTPSRRRDSRLLIGCSSSQHSHSFTLLHSRPAATSPVAPRLDMANCLDFLLGCCALWRVAQRRYDGRNVNLRMSKPDVGSEQVHPNTTAAAAAAITLPYSSKSNSLLVSGGVGSRLSPIRINNNCGWN